MEHLSLTDPVQKAQFSQRVLIKTILNRPDGGAGLSGQTVKIGGWVKTGRKANKDEFAFLEVNDGSCPANLQVIIYATTSPLDQLVSTGACVHVEGKLDVPPEGKNKQKIELKVEKVLDVGPVDPSKYPIPKTKLTLEFLRDHVHLRARTNTVRYIFIFVFYSFVYLWISFVIIISTYRARTSTELIRYISFLCVFSSFVYLSISVGISISSYRARTNTVQFVFSSFV